MLKIRKAQHEAFEEDALDAYVSELMEHCRLFSPDLCKTLDDDDLRGAVHAGVKRAETHGLTLRGPVRFFVDTTIVLGSGFDTDPQYPWAAEMLAPAAAPDPMRRAEALHARIVAYLARVDGENNVHRRKAQAELLRLVDSGIEIPAETFEPDMLALMAQTYPSKAAETGEAALRRLVAEALARGRERYGFTAPRSFALLLVLMFAFGHGCDADPWLPWIARTLRRSDEDAPDRTAARLERRARAWFDAVLANAKEVA
jgi:hypothetical protein